LPASLTPDRSARSGATVSCPLKTTVTLFACSETIDFCIEFWNRAKDHRLQAEFPSGVAAASSASWSTFAVTERAVRRDVPENWVEYPQFTHPSHGYVEACANGKGVSVASQLPEYEAESVVGLAVVRLTLLRCVGWLSRRDLLTRKGNGGWTVETPGAQCLGVHRFSFGVQLGGAGRPRRFAQADRWLHPVHVMQLQTGGALAPGFRRLAFLSGLPEGMALSSVRAVGKKSFDVRFFNIAGKVMAFDLDLPECVACVAKANLAGEPVAPVEIKHGRLSVWAEPGQIMTLRFMLL
jgi:mannosylglycerate hydrolase